MAIDPSPEPSSVDLLPPRRRVYADGMELGVRIGIIGLTIGYALYLMGILAPHVPIEKLMANWHRPAAELILACQVNTGWAWVLDVRESDYLNLLLIAYLASVTIVCCVRLLPFLFRERNLPLLLITVAQLAVLLLAASGLFSGH